MRREHDLRSGMMCHERSHDSKSVGLKPEHSIHPRQAPRRENSTCAEPTPRTRLRY